MKSLRSQFYDLTTKIYKDIDYPNIPIPIYSIFYVIMSQYFKNTKIWFGNEQRSLRLSSFLVMPSRSGKGQLYKIAYKTAEALDIRTVTITDITDAGIIGSIDENAEKYNIKNGFIPGNEKYINPVIYGDLFNYDILFFREAKNLLIKTKYTEKLLSYLQEALDDPGYIRKKLKSIYPIEGVITASIIATTYYMPEIEKTLIDQGFFMRVPLNVRELSIDETRDLRTGVINLFSKTEKVNIDPDIEAFVKETKKIKDRERILTLDESTIKTLHKINENLYLLMKQTTGSKLHILKSLTQTIIDLSIQVGGIHACIEQESVIKEKHIVPASIFIRSCLKTVLDKLELTDTGSLRDKNSALMIRLFRTLQERTGRTEFYKEEFVNHIKDTLKVSRNRAKKLINNMIEDNYYSIEKGERNSKIIKLNNE